MGKNIGKKNGVNLIALYKSVDPCISIYTDLKKGIITKRFREIVEIVIAENFCGNTKTDETTYGKQCKCCVCKEC